MSKEKLEIYSEIGRNGQVIVSTMFEGIRMSKQFYGYTKEEAIEIWRKELEEENGCTRSKRV